MENLGKRYCYLLAHVLSTREKVGKDRRPPTSLVYDGFLSAQVQGSNRGHLFSIEHCCGLEWSHEARCPTESAQREELPATGAAPEDYRRPRCGRGPTFGELYSGYSTAGAAGSFGLLLGRLITTLSNIAWTPRELREDLSRKKYPRVKISQAQLRSL